MTTIQIGYFGLIRCRASLETLAKLRKADPQKFSVTVAGLGVEEEDLGKFCRDHDLEFLGPYRNPDDLAAMYNAIDVAWTAYPFVHPRTNTRLARTNRFFEAATFGVAQIGNGATLEGGDIESRGIGTALFPGTPTSMAAQLAAIDNAQWAEWGDNAALYAGSLPSLEEEIQELAARLRALFASTPVEARCDRP